MKVVVDNNYIVKVILHSRNHEDSGMRGGLRDRFLGGSGGESYFVKETVIISLKNAHKLHCRAERHVFLSSQTISQSLTTNFLHIVFKIGKR